MRITWQTTFYKTHWLPFRGIFLQLLMSSGGPRARFIFCLCKQANTGTNSLKMNYFPFFFFICLFRWMQNFGFLGFSFIGCWRMDTWKHHVVMCKLFWESGGIFRKHTHVPSDFKSLCSGRGWQPELILWTGSGREWVVLLEGWDVKRDTRVIKGLSLLPNLGTYRMFFSSGFAFFFYLPGFCFSFIPPSCSLLLITSV